MDKFQIYKKIRGRSFFNILPEKYHEKILDATRLIQLEVGEEDQLNPPDQALYIVVDGSISLYERNRKLKIKLKDITKGRSLELDRFIDHCKESEFIWKVEQSTQLLEIPSEALFNIFKEDNIFFQYLKKVLFAFELRKLKNDLRLFGFNEDEIQKTFFCLEEHSGGLNEIENAICIIKASAITFYYQIDFEKKVLGDFGVGDFFVWGKNRKVNYEQADNFLCWRIDYNSWKEVVGEEKAKSFMLLVDPFRGKILNRTMLKHTNKNPLSTSEQDDLLIDDFIDDEYVDFDEVYVTSENKLKAGIICCSSLVQSFGQKIHISVFSSVIPYGIEGASLYDIKSCLSGIGFKTLLIKTEMKDFKKVTWPVITKWNDYHVLVYEVTTQYVLVADPLLGKREIPIRDFEISWSKICLICKPTEDFYNIKKGKGRIDDYLNIVFQSKKDLAFIVLSSLLIFVLSLVLPIVTQLIFDVVLVDKNLDMLTALSMIAIVLTFVASLLVFARNYLLTYITTNIDAKFSSLFLARMLSLSRGFFESHPTGDLVSRLNELKRIRKFFTAKTFKLVIDLFSASMFIIILGFYSYKLLVAVFLLLPFLFVFIRILTPKISSTLNDLFSRSAEAQNFLIEQFRSIETVQTLNLEYTARLKWQNRFDNVLILRKRFELLNSVLGAGSEFFLQFIPLIIILFAISLHINGELSLGQVIATSTIVGFIIYPFINLIKVVDEFEQMNVSLKRVDDIITSASEEKMTSKDDQSLKGEINIKNVSFNYGSETSSIVLKGINLKLDVGRRYALVGNSGAGKTTLAQLLIGLNHPTGGEIFYDEIPANQIALVNLRKQIAYVGQGGDIYSGTIVDNISLTDEYPSLEKIIHAAKLADAHSFISALPDGYQSYLGEGGEGLSLGQKQKINIARALYMAPKVLILDEATSVLDSASERKILQNLKDYMKGKTLLLISHRLELLQDVAEMIVLHHGEIVEKGAHNDLLLQQGRYYELWKDNC